MSVMFITSEKEIFKVCTTGGAKIRSQNDLKASLREKECWQVVGFEPTPPIAILDFLPHSAK